MTGLGRRQVVPGLWFWFARCGCGFEVDADYRAAVEYRLFNHECVAVMA